MSQGNLIEFLVESNAIENIFIAPEVFRKEFNGVSTGNIHAYNSVRACHTAIDLAHTQLEEKTIELLHFLQMQNILDREYVGEFRKVPVWVGGHECLDFKKIPKELKQFIKLFEKQRLPELHLHYQFEIIHPFIDGNGRVGRLLYLMDLVRRNMPIKPILTRFDNNRFKYYKAIENYRQQLIHSEHCVS